MMKIFDIISSISAIRKNSQSTDTSKISNDEISKKITAKDKERQQEASRQFDVLLKTIEQENGSVALNYIKQITTDIDARLKGSAFAASSSGPVLSPHHSATSWPDYNDDLYQKILPLCQLAYLEEQNGVPEDHALQLSLIFENEKAVYDYLIKFPEGNSPKQLVHDACLFDLPPADSCDFALWKKIAAKNLNMLNPRFRELLPHAGAIEKINQSTTPARVAAHIIKAKEKELATAIRMHRDREQKPNKNPTEAQKLVRKNDLARLSQEKSRLSLELAELAKGTPLSKASLLVLQALYEQYKTNSSSAHQILIQQGLGEKSIALFYSLKRNNDDKAIPAITIKGSEIGYPGIYLTKLDTQSDQGAALASCLGKLTRCCQYLGGAGEECVRHGIESPNGGFYVLFQGDENNPSLDDRVLAQAWVWRSAQGDLCLDSVEAAPAIDTIMASDMYRYLGMSLCERKGIKQVNIGAYSGISRYVAPESYRASLLSAVDYQGYSDAKQQFLLADSSMPYVFYVQTSSSGLQRVIENKVFLYLRRLFTLTDDLKNNLELKKAIAFLISSKQGSDDSPLFQLLRQAATGRDDEFHHLVDVNRQYAKLFTKNDTNLEYLLDCIDQGAYVGMTDEFCSTLLHQMAGNPQSLKTILLHIPPDQRLEAVRVTNYSWETVLHMTARRPESLKAILELIPEDQRLEAVKVTEGSGKTVLHLAASTPESLKAVLELIPEGQRLEAVRLADKDSCTVLHRAAKAPESLKAVLELIPKGLRFEAVRLANQSLETVLHLAADTPESLKAVLELYPEDRKLEVVRLADRYGFTVLHRAAKAPESLKTVLELIPEGQRFEAVRLADKDGCTVLHRAAKAPESLKAILELIPKGQRLEAVGVADKDGNTLLHLAAGTPESLKAVLDLIPEDQRLEAVKVYDKDGCTVLHRAAGTPESLKAVLEIYPEDQRLEAVRVADKDGCTVLHRAAGSPESLKAVLEIYPEDQWLETVRLADRHGYTLLHRAAKAPESLKAVLEIYPEDQRLEAVGVATKYLETVLHLAARNPESLKALLELYPEDQWLEAVKTADENGNTLLHLAAGTPESLKAVLELIPEGLRLEALRVADKEGYTALKRAAGTTESLKTILELIPESQRLEVVRVTDEWGKTILHWGVRHPESLKTILELIPPEQRLEGVRVATKYLETVLHLAARNSKSLKAILELIPEGQRLEAVNIADKDGRTVLDLATKHPDSLKVIHSLLPKTQDLTNPYSFFSGTEDAASSVPSSVPDHESILSRQKP